MSDLTAERVRELLHYEPATGIFTRRIRTSNRTKVGAIVGADNGKGYLQISVDWRLYSAARLAWLYMTGEWPKEEIDHINRVRSDNRFSNLREATRSSNNCNRRRFVKRKLEAAVIQ